MACALHQQTLLPLCAPVLPPSEEARLQDAQGAGGGRGAPEAVPRPEGEPAVAQEWGGAASSAGANDDDDLSFEELVAFAQPSDLALDSYSARGVLNGPPRSAAVLSSLKLAPDRFLQRYEVTAQSGEAPAGAGAHWCTQRAHGKVTVWRTRAAAVLQSACCPPPSPPQLRCPCCVLFASLPPQARRWC